VAGAGEEAEPWIQRSENILRAESHPVAGMATYYVRGVVELARGRDADALAAFQAAERPAAQLAQPNLLVTALRAFVLQTRVRLGETEEVLPGLGGQDGERGEMRITAAVLRLAQDDPSAAVAALAPVLDGSAPVIWPTWLAQAFLLEAIAQDALGDPGAAERALERSLDLAEPDGVVLWYVLYPVPHLFQRLARHRTTHASLIAEIQTLLGGRKPTPAPAGPQPLFEPLRDSEFRVLRYLPTNLSVPEIAGELSISRNTVKTHMRNLYAKLGTHRRAEAVERARSLGLPAPSARGR
jgi:LuxR family transcriptional regulator, maltose regulon positive regulatory protein